MKQYLDLVRHILGHGEEKKDRTGTGTLSVFGYQCKYDLRDGFPLLTTKKVLFDALVYELLWFLRGSTNIKDDLTQHTPIWNAWARPDGELGPIYGYQWRKWEKFVPINGDDKLDSRFRGNDKEKQGTVPFYRKEHIDQIQQALDLIKKNPDSRRIIVNAWNVADIDKMALPPCHAFIQFYVVNGRLDCQLYQRSADVALGVPFNIASYALLMTMFAMECDLTRGIFVHTLGDAHIYLNHIEGLKLQLERTPAALPRLELPKKNVLDYKFEDFKLVGYHPAGFIKFPIAV